jgi:hypothetical protein
MSMRLSILQTVMKCEVWSASIGNIKLPFRHSFNELSAAKVSWRLRQALLGTNMDMDAQLARNGIGTTVGLAARLGMFVNEPEKL